MSALAAEQEEWKPLPVLRTLGFADKACRTCGWRFFTWDGLTEHEADCDSRPPSPAQVAAWKEAGQRIAATNNARRRGCADCGLVSSPAGIGIHQKATGHAGWTDAA